MTGVRIKSWPASLHKVATDIHFEDIMMNNVPLKVKISKVSYKNIKGTRFTPVAIKLICSKTFPCEGVEIANINLTWTKGNITSIYESVTPTIIGTQNPPICGASAPGVAAVGS
ncbi:hypothetical protein SAY86_019780 [Trapa natans]|uniref:Uncharacterized protein n=1 Tax=Trapa natans TaxID=22666 RepID=A0AAN7R5W2_TRANT|nr:hypothetical protein SAY86_019780 [Trapa natans]